MTEKTKRSTGSSIARGAAWMVLFKVLDRSIGLLSTLVLARVLTPADFGLVAMATAVVALIELMSAFGFDVALIQRRDVTRAHFDTAWTYNALFGIVIGVLLLALALPASDFYREARLTTIMPVLAVASMIQGLENIGTVAFRREMDFRREFRYLLAKRVVSFVITMTLAFTLRNYWALVGGIFAGKLLGVVLSYIVHPYRPRFSLAASGDLFTFSKWLFAGNMVTFLQNRSSDFVLGRTLGASALGLYSISYEIATLPSSELVAPLNRAALPGYAQVAHDLADLREAFLSVIGMIALVALPVGVGLASVASPAVRLLLGEQWLGAIPLIQILAVVGTIIALQSNTSQVVLALGLPRVLTLLNGAGLALLLPALYVVSTRAGLIGIAWVYLAYTLLMTPIVHAVFFHVSGLQIRKYVAAVWRPLTAAITMALVVAEARAALVQYDHLVNAAIELVLCVALGATSYAVVVFALWAASDRPHGAETHVLRLVRSRLRGR
jgi:O-antigen/teichoic acid export membrane protein